MNILGRRQPERGSPAWFVWKRAYDKRRRAIKGDAIRAAKRAAYHATKSYEKGRAVRKRQAQLHGRDYHTRYCRKWSKRHADKLRVYYAARRYQVWYGDFKECAALLYQLQCLIREREPNGYERRKARGYYNNKRTVQERKRDAQISRW